MLGGMRHIPTSTEKVEQSEQAEDGVALLRSRIAAFQALAVEGGQGIEMTGPEMLAGWTTMRCTSTRACLWWGTGRFRGAELQRAAKDGARYSPARDELVYPPTKTQGQ